MFSQRKQIFVGSQVKHHCAQSPTPPTLHPIGSLHLRVDEPPPAPPRHPLWKPSVKSVAGGLTDWSGRVSPAPPASPTAPTDSRLDVPIWERLADFCCCFKRVNS